MKSLVALGAFVLAAAASSCSSVATVAYTNGTITSSHVTHSFEAPQVYRTGRGMRYFVSVEGAPSWEKISIQALQRRGMGRTAERERAKLVLTINVQPAEMGERTSATVASGFTPAVVAHVWYQVRYDNADGVEVSGGSVEYTELISDPDGKVFLTAEAAQSASQLQDRLLSDMVVHQIQGSALSNALEYSERLAQRLFSTQAVSIEVPVIRQAAGVDLEAAFRALNSASTPAELTLAQGLYESAIETLDAQADGADGTARYGVLCGLSACRLMLNDLEGAWSLTTQALEVEPDGVEATAIRAGIYREELCTGLRAIPSSDRKVMDRAAARVSHPSRR